MGDLYESVETFFMYVLVILTSGFIAYLFYLEIRKRKHRRRHRRHRLRHSQELNGSTNAPTQKEN